MIEKENYLVEGAEAVIDKDRASALLASGLKAELFVISTDARQVYLDFKKPSQRGIERATVAEMQKYFDERQFPPGSMGPKVRAAIHFVEHSGKDTIITKTTMLGIDNGGTRITLV